MSSTTFEKFLSWHQFNFSSAFNALKQYPDTPVDQTMTALVVTNHNQQQAKRLLWLVSQFPIDIRLYELCTKLLTQIDFSSLYVGLRKFGIKLNKIIEMYENNNNELVENFDKHVILFAKLMNIQLTIDINWVQFQSLTLFELKRIIVRKITQYLGMNEELIMNDECINNFNIKTINRTLYNNDVLAIDYQIMNHSTLTLAPRCPISHFYRRTLQKLFMLASGDS